MEYICAENNQIGIAGGYLGSSAQARSASAAALS
jgi:hypothetical protein